MTLKLTPPTPTYPKHPQLRAAAEAAARGPVNPATIHLPDQIAARRGYDWATAVIGRPYQGIRHISTVEAKLIELADKAGIDPPLPEWLIHERAETAARRRDLETHRERRAQIDQQTWDSARAACPITLDVRPNRHAGIRHGQRENIRHIVPHIEVFSKSRRRHRPDRALCETPGRRTLRLAEPTTEPATCQRCLAWVTEVKPPTAKNS